MRLANLGGRATLVVPGGDDRGVDIAKASGGKFGPDVQDLYEEWDAFRAFVADLDLTTVATAEFDERDLRAPVPAPRQVFGIGLNYRSHAAESGMDVPAVPATFTKFPASITGPFAEVELPNGTVDWEVELVVVDRAPGRPGRPTPTPGRTSPGSPSARTCPTGRCSSPPAASSAWASRTAASRRSAPGWSLPTSSTTPTTSPSAAASTARPCRTPAPATWSSECRS